MAEKLKKWEKYRLVRIGKYMAWSFGANDVMIYAGNATLRILMSVLPLFMLILAVLNLLPFYSAENFSAELTHFLPNIPEIQSFIRSILIKLNRQSSGALVSLAAVTTLWSASGGIFSIHKALAGITADGRNTPWDRAMAVGYTAFFLLLIIAVLLIQVLGNSILNAAGGLAAMLGVPNLFGLFQQILEVSRIVLLVIMFFFLLLMYRYLPGGKRRWKRQAPGALFTTLLWAAFSALFSYVIPRFWKASAIYGSMAAVFLVALWLQYMIVILLMGGILNQALTETAAAPDGTKKE